MCVCVCFVVFLLFDDVWWFWSFFDIFGNYVAVFVLVLTDPGSKVQSPGVDWLSCWCVGGGSEAESSYFELRRVVTHQIDRQAHVVKLSSKHSESTENLRELTWCRWCKPYILRTPGWAPRRLFEALSGSTLYFIMTFNGHLCHLPLLSNRTRNTKELAHLGSLSCKVLDHVANQIIRQCKLHASALMLMSRTYETLRTDSGPPYLLIAYSPNK